MTIVKIGGSEHPSHNVYNDEPNTNAGTISRPTSDEASIAEITMLVVSDASIHEGYSEL